MKTKREKDGERWRSERQQRTVQSWPDNAEKYRTGTQYVYGVHHLIKLNKEKKCCALTNANIMLMNLVSQMQNTHL